MRSANSASRHESKGCTIEAERLPRECNYGTAYDLHDLFPKSFRETARPSENAQQPINGDLPNGRVEKPGDPSRSDVLLSKPGDSINLRHFL
jgi:hypothetical protein